MNYMSLHSPWRNMPCKADHTGKQPAHVISVAGRIYNAVLSLERRTSPKNRKRPLNKRWSNSSRPAPFTGRKVRTITRHNAGIDLEMFRDQLGAFEVNGDAAERSSQSPGTCSALTPKCTSMKRAETHSYAQQRRRHNAHRAVYEVENDASDTNPTLHDLFQLSPSSSPPVLISPTDTLSAG